MVELPLPWEASLTLCLHKAHTISVNMMEESLEPSRVFIVFPATDPVTWHSLCPGSALGQVAELDVGS